MPTIVLRSPPNKDNFLAVKLPCLSHLSWQWGVEESLDQAILTFETKTMSGPSGEHCVKWGFKARVSSGKFSKRFVLRSKSRKIHS